MKCIYCGYDTQVTNSRPRTLNPSVWRRRQCISCVAQFSTNEMPEYSSSIVVESTINELSPFSRDKLFLSIYKALGHRADALNSATELTNTVIGLTLRKNKCSDGLIKAAFLAGSCYKILKRFDVMAANNYKSYHYGSLK